MLKVYNTASRSLEVFEAREPGRVGIYVCGPTVYDECHLGHARALVAFDVIVRWLEQRGYRVLYVRNITDIDDKIIARAAERGMTCPELAEKYIRSFREEMGKLSLRPPDVEPRATAHIPEMIALIGALWEKGFAYESGGDVYYDVGRFPGYGRLSGRETADLVAGARVEVSERKRNPLDFVLWKAAKPGEPEWRSPWGPGRPGWHVECSAMSARYLGKSFDVHGGGHDLIFPHHENEIAQSEAANGLAPARYWLHNAHVTVDKTKMSKSLGNFFTLKEIFAGHDPAAVRFFLAGRHYRSPIDFSAPALTEAAAALRRISDALSRLAGSSPGGMPDPAPECPPEFSAAMDEDFNATAAMGVVFGLVTALHAELDGRAAGWEGRAREIGGRIIRCCAALGISPAAGPAPVRAGGGELSGAELERCLAAASLRAGEVGRLLETRDALRARMEFAAADRIRARLQALGYEVRDEKGRGGTAARR
jgi:cysteinyl-tRNA synthetase